MSRMRTKSPHLSMVHTNGNLICAIDVETTGGTPGVHEIWQLAILPLDGNLKPSQTATPFYINMRLQRPETIDKKACNVGRMDLAALQLRAIDPINAFDLFVEWFMNLGLAEGKKIMPLASNWVFDRGFLIDWMGMDSFDYYIHFHYRDTQSTALYCNDRADHHVEKVPYPKVGLGALATTFEITNLKPHDALQDCITTAEVYRRMLKAWTPIIPGVVRNEPPASE